MKALVLLLGARSLDVAASTRQRRAVPEPPFVPVASTPETALAWRMWAESGDDHATAAPRRDAVRAPRFPVAHRGSL